MTTTIQFTVSSQTKKYRTNLNDEVDAAIEALHALAQSIHDQVTKIQTEHPILVNDIELDLTTQGFNVDQWAWILRQVTVEATYHPSGNSQKL